MTDHQHHAYWFPTMIIDVRLDNLKLLIFSFNCSLCATRRSSREPFLPALTWRSDEVRSSNSLSLQATTFSFNATYARLRSADCESRQQNRVLQKTSKKLSYNRFARHRPAATEIVWASRSPLSHRNEFKGNCIFWLTNWLRWLSATLSGHSTVFLLQKQMLVLESKLLNDCPMRLIPLPEDLWAALW